MIELVAGLAGRARLTGERLVLSIAAYIVVGILLASTYVALMIAMGLALAEVFGPIAAALAIAGVTLLTAVVVMLLVRWRDRRLAFRQRMLAQRNANAMPASAMAALLPLMMRASPVGTLLAAGAAAYFMSRATTRRRH